MTMKNSEAKITWRSCLICLALLSPLLSAQASPAQAAATSLSKSFKHQTPQSVLAKLPLRLSFSVKPGAYQIRRALWMQTKNNVNTGLAYDFEKSGSSYVCVVPAIAVQSNPLSYRIALTLSRGNDEPFLVYFPLQGHFTIPVSGAPTEASPTPAPSASPSPGSAMEDVAEREIASLLSRVGPNPTLAIKTDEDGRGFTVRFSVQEATPEWDYFIGHRIAGVGSFMYHDLYWTDERDYEAWQSSELERMTVMEYHVLAKTELMGNVLSHVIRSVSGRDFTFSMTPVFQASKPVSYHDDMRNFQSKVDREFILQSPKPYPWGGGLRISARSSASWDGCLFSLYYRSGIERHYGLVRLEGSQASGNYYFDIPPQASRADSISYYLVVEKPAAGFSLERSIKRGAQDFVIASANPAPLKTFDPSIVSKNYSGDRDLESGILFWLEVEDLPAGYGVGLVLRRWDRPEFFVEKTMKIEEGYYSLEYPSEGIGLGRGLEYYYLIRDGYGRAVHIIDAEGGIPFRTTIHQKR